jgi:ATP/maltotriose-dependent transcriptional regulator MalT
MLELLDRANLFLVPLDDSRRWYRYHHLFADVLRTRLLDEHPDRVAALHRRASQWYEQDGEPSPAIRHALAAGDVERAAGLVEVAIPALRGSRQEATIRGWLDAIPDDVVRLRPDDMVRLRPVLAVGFVGALMAGGEFGDLGAARRAYSVGAEGLRRAGHIADVLGCSITLADIRITQGRLSEALRTYEQALRLASGEDGTVLRGTADMYVGMSQIACERDELPAATQHPRRAEELGEHTWLPQNPYRWRVAMARIREAEGDLDGALDLLDEAQRVYMGDFSPNVRPIPALPARVLAAQGRVGDALAWAREQGLSVEDDLSYLREFEHVTLARVLLALSRAQASQPPIHDAARLLQRLLPAAEAGQRTGTVIEILVLQSLTDHARGDVPGALAALERALTLAEPEGYVRMFTGDTKNIHAKLGVNSRRAAVRQAAELNLLSRTRDR